MAKKINVILITIDSLRADKLGFNGCTKNLSPSLDKLAKESCVFLNAFSTGPMTPHSFTGILTSTYPLDYYGPTLRRNRRLISELLQKEGFVTAGFHSNIFLTGSFGYGYGWDFFEEVNVSSLSLLENKFIRLLKEFGKLIFLRTFPIFYFFIKYLGYKKSWKNGLENEGKIITKIAKDFISAQVNEKPFFLWLHYNDVHSPYIARESLEARPFSFNEYIASRMLPLVSDFSKRNLKRMAKKYLVLARSLYDDGIKYIDNEIESIINLLKERGIYDNTIIIFTSDHGEEFLEHEGASHEAKLYNELLHVPLLVKVPGITPGTFSHQVSLLDLPTTICDLLDVPRHKTYKGRNLFTREHLPVFHETADTLSGNKIKLPLIDFLIRSSQIDTIKQCKIACQFENYKYILNYDYSSREELYDLLNDPHEQVNIAAKSPEAIQKMQDLMFSFLQSNPPLVLLGFPQKPKP